MTKTMKTYFTQLFILFFMLQGWGLLGQEVEDIRSSIDRYTASSNQLIIIYSAETTDSEMDDIRETYGITDIDDTNSIQVNVYNAIHINGRTIDIWTINTWPIIISGEPDIQELGELAESLGINPDGQGDENSEIDNLDLNYYVNLESFSTSTSSTYNSNPIPACPDEIHRVIGSSISRSTDLNIIIFDQIISEDHLSYFPQLASNRIIPINNYSEGNHGAAVTSIIKNTLNEANMTDYQLTSLGVFNGNGSASYENILEAFEVLEANNIQNAIINMSASAIVQNTNNYYFQETLWGIIGDYLETNQILLVSSGSNSPYIYSPLPVGDQGHGHADVDQEGTIDQNGSGGHWGGNVGQKVYPGCAGIHYEITVAGLDNCYTSLASFAGGNNTHFEIGAQASQVLFWDGDYQIGDGVSYAVPFVTSAAAQLAQSGFSISQIKDRLLSYADTDSNLAYFIKEGKVLNVANALNSMTALQAGENTQAPHQGVHQTKTSQKHSTFISPNPFNDHLNINLNHFSPRATVALQLFDLTGQLVAQKEAMGANTIEWNTPTSLPKGSYWLKIQTSNEVISQKLVKF